MELFQQPLRPINLGLESFYDSMASQGAEPVAVDWRPPLDGYAELSHTRAGVDIDAANAEAVRRICAGRPMLVGMGIARDVIPGFAPSGKARLLITHSGPPITWSRMCGPTRGAIMGALIYEGLAETPEGAADLAASGAIEFAPCHHYHAVGPMAGIISPSMPVFIVKNEATGDVAFATQNEGLGKVLRYGAYGPEVVHRLKWMETTLYPALQAALALNGPIDLRSMIAQALHMGDECHNRNKAGTSLFIRTLAPALVEAVNDPAAVAAVLRFMDGNDHFFLNLSMPAMKAMLLPAETSQAAPSSPPWRATAPTGASASARPASGGLPRRRRWSRGSGCPVSPRPTPTPTSATARSPRRAGSAGLRWRARRPSSSSSAARRRCAQRHAGHVRNLRGRSIRRSRSRRSISAARRSGSTCARSCGPASPPG